MEPNSRRSNNGQILRSLSRSTSPTRASVSTKSVASSSFNNKFSLERKTSSYCSTSRTNMNLFNKSAASPLSSVRFNSNRTPRSPNRPVFISDNRKLAGPSSQTKRTCLCSPTNHPGSFRCSLHKNTGKTTSSVSNKLERSAMANSLTRHGAVEGDFVKRALAALIRPSSHQLRRRENFQSRPSRLSVMSNVLPTSLKDRPVLNFDI